MAGFGLLRELASREPAGRWLYELVQFAKWFLCSFCSMSATKEPVQPYNLVSRLHSPFWSVTTCPPSAPASHAFVSTHDTSSARATGQIFYLIWWESLEAAKSAWGCLKGDKSMHLLCNFHTRACFPWQATYNGFKSLKPFISKLLICDSWIGFLKFSHILSRDLL